MDQRLCGIALATLFAASACSSSIGGPSALPAPVETSGIGPGKYIKHVIVIVQENRSFDDLFNCFPGTACVTTAPMADPNNLGHVTQVAIHPLKFVNCNAHTAGRCGDIDHDYRTAILNWDGGKMDGFARNTFGAVGGGAPTGDFAYAYVDRSEVKPYWDMAKQYTLLDRMFPDMFGPSFTAHLSLIAGTTAISAQQAEVDTPEFTPWTCAPGVNNPTVLVDIVPVNAPGYLVPHYNQPVQPCFTQFSTMADALDAKNVSWHYYAPTVDDEGGQIWSEFGAIKKVRYGPDWANVITPQTTVLKDIKNGTLPSMSWVIPDMLDSDHPSSDSNKGPSWVATVVNTVGQSKYWDSTAIVVVWDDWGGWYDHVKPPQVDYDGLGIRVGSLIISPYAQHGVVVHDQYQFASILHFVEDVFGLASLGHRDATAPSLTGAFDFTQKPSKFKPFPVPEDYNYFLHRPPSRVVPDRD
jgi:phospholipase C